MHQCFYLVNIISGTWPVEAKDKSCSNNSYYHISSQHECQQICIGKNGCVGILYKAFRYPRYHRYYLECKVCMDDNLTTSMDGFGFYRRPGIIAV